MSAEKSFYNSSSTFREKGDETGVNLQSFAIELVGGQQCQLECTACYKGASSTIGESSNIPFEEVKDMINQAVDIGFQEIVIIGGEPTLHKDVFNIINYIREKGVTPILCTNGIIFQSKKNAEKLRDTGTVVVTHAVFPNGEEIIDKFSGVKGYTKGLKRAIDNLKQIPGTTLVLEMPLNDELFPHAFEFFKYCRENNVTPFIEISRSLDTGESTTTITPEQIAQLFQKFQEFDEQYFPELTDQIISPPAYGNKCTMSMTGLHIKNAGNNEYGKVYSCCAQDIDHGDLTEQSLVEIMKSKTLQVFMDQDKYIVGPCSDCDLYDICKGGCRGEAYLKFNCPRASSPACHLIPEETRNDKSKMAPASCEGCPAQESPNCSLK